MHDTFARPLLALALCALCALCAPPPSRATPAPALADADSPLGTNLSELSDISDEEPLLDHFKLSRDRWLTQCRFGEGCSGFDSGEQDRLDLDADGWVRSLTPRGGPAQFNQVAALLMDGGASPARSYAGRYVVRYEGQGALAYSGAQLAASAPGRDLIDVGAAGQLQIIIRATDPGGAGDYIRNIRVVREAEEARLLAGEVFSPTWLARLAPFRTLRFMDWMRTNQKGLASPPDLAAADFSLRARLSDARYTSERGAPAELIVRLANETRSEPWLSMPTQASDSYVRQLAELVRGALAPDLRVYVEYSNEVWNYGYAFHPDGGYIDQRAAAEFGAAGDSDFTRRMNWHGKRTAEVCAIWRAAFAGRPGQVVCVLGAQAANTFTASEALDCPLWVADPDNADPAGAGRSCRAGVDAVAIAPYFGSYIGSAEIVAQAQLAGLTVAELFDEIGGGGVVAAAPGAGADLPAGGALAESFGWMDAYDALGEAYGLSVVAYEGGQHLAEVPAPNVSDPGYDPAVTDLLLAANRDARMGQAYARYLAYWRSGGPSSPNRRRQLFVHYTLAGRYSAFGAWGALEQIGQAGSPKYDALAAFAAGPCWWQGCAIAPAARQLAHLPLVRR